jgi:hypothetical protein
MRLHPTGTFPGNVGPSCAAAIAATSVGIVRALATKPSAEQTLGVTRVAFDEPSHANVKTPVPHPVLAQ